MKFYVNEPGTDRTEDQTVKADVHVYEVAGRNPVFVIFERNDSPKAYTSETTQTIADWAQETYSLKPEQLKFYEKGRDSDRYQRVTFRELGAEQEKTGQWDECRREKNIGREKMNENIGANVFLEPDLGQRVERVDEWSRANVPSVESFGTVADREDHTIKR